MQRIEGVVTGGCQCGAVRYRADEMLDSAHICHCRMCQKAVGGPFAALIATPRAALHWTRGAPEFFMSSARVARGFCGQCGTPLFYETVEGDYINLTICSLDEPARFPPREQVGMEGCLPWFAGLHALPDQGTTEEEMPQEAAAIAASNHQHPDHDTERWP